MIAEPLRRSAQLLDCVDALRNGPALALLLGTLVLATLVVGAGGWLAQVSVFFSLLFALMAAAVVLWGTHAVGVMMWDEATGVPARHWTDAVDAAVHHGHRMLGVALLVAGAYVVLLLAVVLLVVVCKLPFMGPILYTAVFPVAALAMGLAMVAVPALWLPLIAPALWSGQRVWPAVSAAVALARQRAPLVLIWMLALGVLVAVIASLAAAVVLTGMAMVTGLSAPILGPAVVGGLVGGPLGSSMGSAMGAVQTTAAYVLAASLGGGILMAVAFTAPALVYLRGVCTVYLMATDGLDLSALQADVQAQAQARWQRMGERFGPAAPPASDVTAAAGAAAAATPPAPASTSSAAAAPMAPEIPPGPVETPPKVAPVPPPPAAVVPPPPPPPPPAALPVAPPITLSAAAAADAARTACPQCGARVAPTDAFCGECGFALRPRA